MTVPLSDRSEVGQLERQVERSQLLMHTAFGQTSSRIDELSAFLHGMIDLLLAKGLITDKELLDSIDVVRGEMATRAEVSEPRIAMRFDPPKETGMVAVDCEARMHVCKGVCCRLHFALSVREVEAGHIKWDLGRPYIIRQESDGYCTHNDRGDHGCSIYEHRPTVCKRYSCAGDERIWKDFEKMELNTEWIDRNLSGTQPRLIEISMEQV